MGICSSQLSRKNGRFISWTNKVMIIHSDGKLQELKQPMRASHVLSDHPNHILASSESMYVDSVVPAISSDAELELGQIYFLLPVSQSHKVLSLHDLCRLAIKASIALGFPGIKRSDSNVAKLVAQARSSCLVLTAFDAIGALYPQPQRDSRKIEFQPCKF